MRTHSIPGPTEIVTVLVEMAEEVSMVVSLVKIPPELSNLSPGDIHVTLDRSLIVKPLRFAKPHMTCDTRPNTRPQRQKRKNDEWATFSEERKNR